MVDDQQDGPKRDGQGEGTNTVSLNVLSDANYHGVATYIAPRGPFPGDDDPKMAVEVYARTLTGVAGTGRLHVPGNTIAETVTAKLFGLGSQGAGQGWDAGDMSEAVRKSEGKCFTIVTTKGGIRDQNTGKPIALGYHTGHFELGLLAEAAAKQFKELKKIPYSVSVSDVCDGLTQGTHGMMDSLPYRNSGAHTMASLMRSHPFRSGVMGIATCDKGVPATLMALAGEHDKATIFVPGGVSLASISTDGSRIDAKEAQAVSALVANNQMTEERAQEAICSGCSTPGGGCQFLGTAATSQVVAEALGMTLPHAALAPSGHPIWQNIATDSATALVNLYDKGITTKDILTKKAIENAMIVHAAFGGSSNLLLHIPAIAYEGRVKDETGQLWQPAREDWERINRSVPRLVDVMPNGNHVTVSAFMAGGVPEVMLHLRELGLLHIDVMTVTSKTLGENLDAWEESAERKILRDRLQAKFGIDPDEIIFSPQRAKAAGLTGTLTFPDGNLAPQGSVIKSTAIDPAVVGLDPLDSSKPGQEGVYHKLSKVRVFTSEDDIMDAIRGNNPKVPPLDHKGGIIVYMGAGPMGMGMPETFQVTNALRMVDWGKNHALITDGRFSGVSAGACIGHIGPEALSGGPIGKLKDGDVVEIKIDTKNLTGRIDFVGADLANRLSAEEGARILEKRGPNSQLHAHADLPPHVKLWGELQNASGGTWRGSTYDVEKIIETLKLGQQKRAELAQGQPDN